MRKLISRTLISAKINLVKIWKKKKMCDFDICSFVFLPWFYAVLWSSRKCYGLYCLQLLSKNRLLWQNFFMEDMRYEHRKNDIPSLALVTLYKKNINKIFLVEYYFTIFLQRLIFSIFFKEYRTHMLSCISQTNNSLLNSQVRQIFSGKLVSFFDFYWSTTDVKGTKKYSESYNMLMFGAEIFL